MNIRMITLIALMVIVTAGAASAETVEVRGTVVNIDGVAQGADIQWDATNFAVFWYDLDDDLQTERLTIEAGSLSDVAGSIDRSIDKDTLTYSTHPVPQEYELYENEGLTVDGDTGYYLEGWMAERYVAINAQPEKLCELLVEFEDDDNKTLILGENWSLGGGFSLVVSDIDLEGTKVRLYLRKDGLELDNKTVSVGEVYTYTVDLAGEYGVPVFSCYVNAVIKETNTTQVKYVFLIDNDVLEIETSDEFGIMEATVSGNFVNLTNKDVAVDLSSDSTEHIMGNMYFKTAKDEDSIRFYPYVVYTEPGTYEVRGTVVNIDGVAQGADIQWDATNFAAFWYDLDDDLLTERLTIKAGSLSDTAGSIDRSIDKNNLTYSTHPVAQEYKLSAKAGLVLEPGTCNRTHYFIEGWMGEKYVSLNAQPEKLCKLLVEFDGDDTKTLYLGKIWNISGEFALELLGIDVTGNKATLQLSKNDVPLDLKCIDTSTPDKNDAVYTYLKDIAGEDDVPVFHCYVDVVFKGDSMSYVQLKYVFLIDDDAIEIKTGDKFGIMEATVSGEFVNLINKDDAVDLSLDSTEHVMGDIYFKTAKDDTAIRFYPFVERTITGGGDPTPPPPATIPADDADHDGVPDVWNADNSTQEGYWVNSEGIGRRWGDMNGDGVLTSVDALMILQAAADRICL